MPMKIREIITLLKKDGWYEVGQDGSHRQYKHSTKKGKITIPIHSMNADLTPGTENSILKQAGLK
mgnify:CR=1 FL=1